jgi:hypothetical protein
MRLDSRKIGFYASIAWGEVKKASQVNEHVHDCMEAPVAAVTGVDRE